ncbi:methionine--tRNA ligase [Tichowtungia aerotolerans]|uniref:Methionine--tRNA ligase n=2 Tax=Tichowtungia aerotolerans TaxID=2697043 RepID=A0A6P1M4B4_9BACT|nr:methionine--tRNA ligase [Tichowtungia aerotolerans]
MDTKYYVTTPIYYVNDKPHIGHAYTTILADVLANYHRLLGTPTYFLTGTDEHGQKVQQAAEKNGISAQEQCDQTVVRFQELWKRLEISNDDFIRTTEYRHKKIVQEVLQDLYDRDEIYRAEYEGWYCVGCERFFTEKDLVEGNCPECGRKVDAIVETNYFFRMSHYQQWLIEYIETHPEFIQPDFRANETLGFLKNNELQDLCISRPKSRLAWGIELPFDSDFVTYVWFDALLNYITAIGYKSDDDMFKKWWPVNHQLIGKDILTTHTVYWPTMLKAMGVELPKTVFAHGWWLTGRTKMSKSLGNVVNPMEMIDRYGVDAFRYFLIAEMTLGQDASFTEEAFVRRYNSDLANDLGNLLSRTSNMLGRYCDGKFPAIGNDAVADGPEKELWDAVQQAVTDMEASIGSMHLNGGIASVLAAVRKVNQYFEIKQPWTLAKEGRTEEVETTLAVAAEALRVSSALLYPVMPERMGELRTLFGLGMPDMEHLRVFGVIKAGSEVPKTDPLFPRVELPKEEKPPKPSEKENAVTEKQEKPEGVITYDDVMNVKLRTAKILEAEKVEGADKLLKLQVEVGEEKRQLIAGIAQHYSAEEVVGKTIVIVANLKPAKIRGVESQGMLLCASVGKELRLITVDGELPASGAAVK